MASPPIPHPTWAAIVAFLAAGKTGSITLNVHQGQVRDCVIEERIRERHAVESAG